MKMIVRKSNYTQKGLEIAVRKGDWYEKKSILLDIPGIPVLVILGKRKWK